MLKSPNGNTQINNNNNNKVEKSKFVDYYPVSTVSEDSVPVEFFVPCNGEDYLDPNAHKS